MFADDAVLLARSAPELQRVMDTFSAFCDANSLVVNPSKTKCMLVNCVGAV